MTPIRALVVPIRHLLVVLFISILLSACLPAATGPASTQPVVPTTATRPITPSQQQPSAAATQPAAPESTTPPIPSQPALKWQEIASGLRRPVDLAPLADGSGKFLLVEQPGVIRLFDGKTVRSEPFMDITGRVGSQGNEQGLLGIAMHPRFVENQYFYVNYTDKTGATNIARFQAAKSFDRADPASEKNLLLVKQPFVNHNGGSMVFGPDGFLYMGLGDGGSGGDPQRNGQNLNTLLGKILRIDVNSGERYAFPTGNPFVNGGGLAEIWAIGLRNPWRFSFDRQTGDLYIADVGQAKVEEVNFLAAPLPAGTNFGWNFREGSAAYQGQPPAGLKLIDPVWEYGHDLGCSVTGGFVYRGKALPELAGTYLYADYCSGVVWGLQRDATGKWQNRELIKTGANPSSFGQDSDGELYLMDHNAGKVLKLVKN